MGLLKEKYANIDFGVGPLPEQNGGFASFAGGDSIGIPAGSKKVKEAWEFIQWCLKHDTQINEFAKNWQGSRPNKQHLAGKCCLLGRDPCQFSLNLSLRRTIGRTYFAAAL
jgi:multiple sugar transport system substrate-binding protein